MVISAPGARAAFPVEMGVNPPGPHHSGMDRLELLAGERLPRVVGG